MISHDQLNVICAETFPGSFLWVKGTEFPVLRSGLLCFVRWALIFVDRYIGTFFHITLVVCRVWSGFSIFFKKIVDSCCTHRSQGRLQWPCNYQSASAAQIEMWLKGRCHSGNTNTLQDPYLISLRSTPIHGSCCIGWCKSAKWRRDCKSHIILYTAKIPLISCRDS
jgi:hypothetical protein